MMTRYDGPIPIRKPRYTTFLYVGFAIVMAVLFVWGFVIAGSYWSY